MKQITILYDDLHSGERQEAVSGLESIKLRLQAIADKYSARVGMPFGIDLLAVTVETAFAS